MSGKIKDFSYLIINNHNLCLRHVNETLDHEPCLAYLSNLKSGHTISRARRVGATHGGAAGQGGSTRVETPAALFVEKTDFLFFSDSTTTVLDVSSKREQAKLYINR